MSHTPLYGAWNGKHWAQDPTTGIPMLFESERVAAALVVNYGREMGEVREIGPDGQPLDLSTEEDTPTVTFSPAPPDDRTPTERVDNALKQSCALYGLDVPSDEASREQIDANLKHWQQQYGPRLAGDPPLDEQRETPSFRREVEAAYERNRVYGPDAILFTLIDILSKISTPSGYSPLECVAWLIKRVECLEDGLAALDANLQRRIAENAELRELVKKLELELAKSREHFKSNWSLCERLEKQNQEWEKENAELREENRLLERSLAECRTRVTLAEDLVQRLDRVKALITEERDNFKKQVQQLDAVVTSDTVQIAQRDNTIKQLRSAAKKKSPS